VSTKRPENPRSSIFSQLLTLEPLFSCPGTEPPRITTPGGSQDERISTRMTSRIGRGGNSTQHAVITLGAGGGADRRIGIQGRTSLQAGSGSTCSTHREEEGSVACQGSRVPAPPNQGISQVEGAVQPQSRKVHGDGGGEGQRPSHKVMLMRWRPTGRERQRLRAPDPAITDILS
jgi:hypothetical protein